MNKIMGSTQKRHPNFWDLLAFTLMLGGLFLLGWGATTMSQPYHLGDVLPISLAPEHLPEYALYTVLRMFIALAFSLIATLILGTLAAKYTLVGRILIPLVDVLQSIPVLGFLSISVWGFIAILPGNRLGPECACIFALFTAQVWNMILSLYQSLRTVPTELCEASTVLGLSSWQHFWRIELPFAMPNLLSNMMVSMSAGWFFVVASESMWIANQSIALPGMGSYIALAIDRADLPAIFYAIVTMLLVILLYDQLIFRPIIYWADRFKIAPLDDSLDSPWVTALFNRTQFLRHAGSVLKHVKEFWLNSPWCCRRPKILKPPSKEPLRFLSGCFCVLFVLLSLVLFGLGCHLMHQWFTFKEVIHVLLLGCATAVRIAVLVVFCLVFWVPIGVWIGLRPQVARWVQPFIQFLAAFPANLLFPLVVIMIVRFHLNVEIWTAPLMILGAQWYILFNTIAGAASLPKPLHQAAKTLHLRGWLRWRRLIIPGILPSVLTGTVSAAGGAWNASILAESVNWGDVALNATGLGGFITQMTRGGHFPELSLGIAVMCFLVIMINILLWRPLYQLVEKMVG